MSPRPERIRITRVGFWYVLFTVLVGVAATNTGNNALYLVLATMLGLLIVSGVVSRTNVRGLRLGLAFPDEVFANQPFWASLTVVHTRRWLPRWLLVVSLSNARNQLLVPYLKAGEKLHGHLELMLPRRGLHVVSSAHLWSVFPLGLFSKGMRHPVGTELLVYPELFSGASDRPKDRGDAGDEAIPRRGWGHELLTLRDFQVGDDPRSIHWKQSARTGQMITMEREAEEGRRLSILFDNGVGELGNEEERARFETLISEAATAADHYLERGFEVQLITRDALVPFASGPLQRRRILEQLALIDAVPRQEESLEGPDPRMPQLRLGMEGRRGEAA